MSANQVRAILPLTVGASVPAVFTDGGRRRADYVTMPLPPGSQYRQRASGLPRDHMPLAAVSSSEHVGHHSDRLEHAGHLGGPEPGYRGEHGHRGRLEHVG